jgi:hypothetical protein
VPDKPKNKPTTSERKAQVSEEVRFKMLTALIGGELEALSNLKNGLIQGNPLAREMTANALRVVNHPTTRMGIIRLLEAVRDQNLKRDGGWAAAMLATINKVENPKGRT